MEQKASPVAIIIAAAAVIWFASWMWRRNAGAPTPVVDPNNPLPGMGPINRGGEGVGASPASPSHGPGR